MEIKGNQHNWYRRILRKINLKQTLSKKEFGYYREIFKDDQHKALSVMYHLNNLNQHDTIVQK